MRAEVRERLACPACRTALADSDEGLTCPGCRRRYVYAGNGAPVLFPESHEVPMAQAQELYAKPRPRIVQLLRGLLAPADLKVGETLHDRLREQVVFGAPPGSLVLNFGSGTDRFFDDARFVNFDIFAHGNTDVVGDGHHLPFQHDSFDVVWCSAVLEHIRKPWLVAAEIHRVLKPGGLVLVSVPFVQKLHGAPHDYFRYTPDGLRSVFDAFEEVAAGPSFTGPTGTVVHVLAAWFNAVLPGRLGFGLEALTGRVLSVFKHIDRVVTPADVQRGVLTGGSCYLGRKPERQP